MLKTFEDLQKQIKQQVWKSCRIDNIAFRLHYRLTFWILLTATILVSSRQYIGEHIRCISDTIKTNVVETFCFFTTTFTVPRHFNDSQVPHPGVGPMGRGDLEEEPVLHHAYYQWVPFVLFGQALMFYLPHLLWRTIEGGTIKVLVKGLELGYIALGDSEVGKAPSKAKYMKQVGVVRLAFMNRLKLNQWWGHWLMGCELLNAVNLCAQIVLTDAFLGGQFLGLGPAVAKYRAGDTDPLDIIFPKVTKCTFLKYGPTGTIQKHDALCVMALNVINEKIYTFLWFWFVFLAVVTSLALLWRGLTLVMFNRSLKLNRVLFDYEGRLNPDDFETVISRCEFSHWMFLYYLCTNMHLTAKNQLFSDLAAEMRDRKSNGYHNRATLPLSVGDPASPSSVRPRPSTVTLDEPDAGDGAPPSMPLLSLPVSPDRPHSD